MKRCIGLLLCILLLTSVVGCGKKNPSSTPTPTPDSTPTATATPTDEPVVRPEQPPIREILDGISAISAQNSFSLSVTVERIYQGAPYDKYVNKKKVIYDPENQAVSLYYENVDETDEDESERTYTYFFYKADGGINVKARYENGIKYKIRGMAAHTCEKMYALYREMFTANGKPIAPLYDILSEVYEGMPIDFLKDDKNFRDSVEQLATLFDDEKNLKSILGYEKLGEGKYAFSFDPKSLPIPELTDLLKSPQVATQFYMYGPLVPSIVTNVRLEVTVEEGVLSDAVVTISTNAELDCTITVKVYDVGKTTYMIPENMRQDYENAKVAYKNQQEERDMLANEKRLYDEFMDGTYERDVQTVQDLFDAYAEAFKDSETEKAILNEIHEKGTGGKELLVTYSNGDKVDQTGIPLLDAALKKEFKAGKFELNCFYYQDYILTLALRDENGKVALYYGEDFPDPLD